MLDVLTSQEQYLACFTELETNFESTNPQWINRIRKDAIGHFGQVLQMIGPSDAPPAFALILNEWKDGTVDTGLEYWTAVGTLRPSGRDQPAA